MSADRHVADVVALFDVVVESSVVGLRKPDAAFYALACERLGSASRRPKRCSSTTSA